jgi:hypothetical protein
MCADGVAQKSPCKGISLIARNITNTGNEVAILMNMEEANKS